MTDSDFSLRMIADLVAAEPLPQTMAFTVPSWWLHHPELLAHLKAMDRNGQAVVVQEDLRLETVPLADWLVGFRRRKLKSLMSVLKR